MKMYHPNIKRILLFAPISTLMGLALLMSHIARAYASSPPPIFIRPVVGFTSAQDAMSTLLSVVAYVGGLLCFFYLVWGAYKYLTAGDNSANTAAARQTMLNAVIGLILLGLVVVLFRIVTQIIGAEDIFFN
jgi:hypothetical protein